MLCADKNSFSFQYQKHVRIEIPTACQKDAIVFYLFIQALIILEPRLQIAFLLFLFCFVFFAFGFLLSVQMMIRKEKCYKTLWNRRCVQSQQSWERIILGNKQTNLVSNGVLLFSCWECTVTTELSVNLSTRVAVFSEMFDSLIYIFSNSLIMNLA